MFWFVVTQKSTFMEQNFQLQQYPAPGSRLVKFRGDTVEFQLNSPCDLNGSAWIRTNIGHGRTIRQEIIQHVSHTVLSLGGGTPCYGNNMRTILNSEDVKSIYLKASIPSLIDRLKNETIKRPLISHIKTNHELTEFIGKHLFERSPYYDQAHFKIRTDNTSREEIVDEIIKVLI